MPSNDTPARESYDVIVKGHVAPVMKAAGFKKAGTQWRLRGEIAWGVVNMQKSAFSSRDEISFTMNVGVRFDAAHRAAYPNAKRMWEKPPTEPECHVRERIGWFMPEPHDHWWNVVDHRDVPKIVGELVPLLREKAVPWVVATMNDAEQAAKMLEVHSSRPRTG